MPNFIIRVELHGANAFHYVHLAEALSRSGITDIIAGDNGKLYKLPTGLYQTSSLSDQQSILNTVKFAAESTGRPYEALVCEGNSTWINLPTV